MGAQAWRRGAWPNLGEEALENRREEGEPLVNRLGPPCVAGCLADVHLVDELCALVDHRAPTFGHRLLCQQHGAHRGVPNDRIGF